MPHPLDPLLPSEIILVARTVNSSLKGDKKVSFNTITLLEPHKDALQKHIFGKGPKPPRKAEAIVIGIGTGQISEVIVGIEGGKAKVEDWKDVSGVQPTITLEDLTATEEIIRKDPGVIEQCKISGVTDMSKVYCDPWTIGYDERWGHKIRLQQALMYYRPSLADNQYSLPFDFCPIVDTENGKVITIDIPKIRRPIPKSAISQYLPGFIAEEYGNLRKDLKPLEVIQPEGVSYKLRGRELEWQNFKFHIGFNYREGIVLNNITYNDHGNVRPLFWRMSIAEMVVPYGCPEFPHTRKHAFDLGEYGAGFMANSLALGCDCKGAITYLDASFNLRNGDPYEIKNAICIHEEDSGVLHKHTDYRTNHTMVTRARKLVVSQTFTAANYDYLIYWSFHTDGNIQLELKLTGILNTYVMNPGEETHGWGTQVHPGVNAHNHQHLFCLRVDPQLDGNNNSIVQCDAMQSSAPVGSPENKYGNAFYSKNTIYKTPKESISDYNSDTSRSWSIINPNKKHPATGAPVAYKLVSREVPRLMPKEGGLVWKRGGFARHAIHVTPYAEDQIYPAGKYVPQTSGEPSMGLPQWIEDTSSANIENTDVVLWHTFGLTHFPRAEDFPLMPTESVSLILRPNNFFVKNPGLDIRPSACSFPGHEVDGRDKGSVYAKPAENMAKGCGACEANL